MDETDGLPALCSSRISSVWRDLDDISFAACSMNDGLGLLLANAALWYKPSCRAALVCSKERESCSSKLVVRVAISSRMAAAIAAASS